MPFMIAEAVVAATCMHAAGGVSALLGHSYERVALQMLNDVYHELPQIAAKMQPAKLKPYLAAVLKVRLRSYKLLHARCSGVSPCMCVLRLLPSSYPA